MYNISMLPKVTIIQNCILKEVLFTPQPHPISLTPNRQQILFSFWFIFLVIFAKLILKIEKQAVFLFPHFL